MKCNAHIQTWLLAALLIGWGCLIASCSDHADDGETGQDGQPSVPLQVASLTRGAGDEPEASTPDPFKGMSIQLFLIPQNSTAGTTTLKGKAIYSNASSPWFSTIKVTDTGVYKVFGFMPADVSIDEKNDGVTINGSTATLTINKMRTVSDLDVCVITGVKNHPLDASKNEKVLAGIFDYTATADPMLGYGVSLLAEHLYAAVEFQFKLVEDYNNLRTIKLKQVILKNTQKAIQTSIPLTMGTEESPVPNPIGTISMADVDSESLPDVHTEATLFNSTEGVELKTTDAEVIKVTGYFAPGYSGGLSIESVYDVYDKVGEKPIRENCHAENKIGSLVTSLERGKKKIIKMTVDPTYLYVLSDNDPGVPNVTAGD